MRKRNWVCFDCRTVVRREPYSGQSVACATCHKPRVNLGYKIPIPAKTRVKEWATLQEEYFASARAAERKRNASAVRRRHDLEQEIARLESRPTNTGRTKAIQTLRKRQGGMDA